jgi:hypothetical protein
MVVHPHAASTIQAQEAAIPAGAPGRGEFRCAGCGYGACCKIAPERCPMCSGSVWNYVDSASDWEERELDSIAPLSRGGR